MNQGTPEWGIDPITGTVDATIDLGAPHDVQAIGWLTIDSTCAPLLGIEVSSDGITWTPIEPLPPPAAPGVWNVASPLQTARMIRWVSSAPDPVQVTGCLAEVAVWATPAIVEPSPAPTEPATEPETGTPVPASEKSGDD